MLQQHQTVVSSSSAKLDFSDRSPIKDLGKHNVQIPK